MDRFHRNSLFGKGAGYSAVIGLILLLGGVVLRFWRFRAKSLWLDEAVTFFLASLSPWRIILDSVGREAHPPLFPLLVHPVLKMLPDEAGLRFLPALFSALILVLVVLTAKALDQSLPGNGNLSASGAEKRNVFHFCSGRLSVLCLLLLGTSAFQVFFAQEGRMYTLFGLLSLACFFTVVQLSREGAHGRWLLVYAVVSVLGLYTHLYFVLVIVAANVWMLVLRLIRRRRDKGLAHHNLRAVLRWSLTQGAIAACFLPWVPVVLRRMSLMKGAAVATRGVAVTPLGLLLAFNQINIGYGVVTLPGLLIGTAVFLVLLAVGAVSLWPSATGFGRRILLPLTGEAQQSAAAFLVFLGIPFTGVVLLAGGPQGFEAKHLFFLTPVYWLFVAWCLLRMRQPIVRGVLVVVMVTFNVLGLTVYFSRDFQKERWREAVAYVQERRGDGDVVVFNPRHVAFPFRHYEKTCIPWISSNDPAVVEDSIVRMQTSRIWLVEDYSPVAGPRGSVRQVVEEHGNLEQEKVFPGALGVIVLRLYAPSGR